MDNGLHRVQEKQEDKIQNKMMSGLTFDEGIKVHHPYHPRKKHSISTMASRFINKKGHIVGGVLPDGFYHLN